MATGGETVKVRGCFPHGRIELSPSGSLSGRAVHVRGFISASIFSIQKSFNLSSQHERLRTDCMPDAIPEVEHTAAKRQT